MNSRPGYISAFNSTLLHTEGAKSQREQATAPERHMTILGYLEVPLETGVQLLPQPLDQKVPAHCFLGARNTLPRQSRSEEWGSVATGFPLHLAIPRRKGGKATSRKNGSQGKQPVNASRSPRLCPGVNFIPLLRATRNPRKLMSVSQHTFCETSAGLARPRSLKRRISSARPAEAPSPVTMG